ncbi:hypothetical protein BGZ61DRAFT_437162 [Ilyonectria robusta]|uniref:uncharacterized protein n=1 Tax=Ilyonectria robusta TaxID=1079257 RepID=UPI001E8E55D6|nr:uncharacterized protein BGZ61DRAFT_437162 [Ilyonectria robusta]KAH8736856.1 hypothetical protein BGZ61DRAFT_437162 [Ilyonectria robusta]
MLPCSHAIMLPCAASPAPTMSHRPSRKPQSSSSHVLRTTYSNQTPCRPHRVVLLLTTATTTTTAARHPTTRRFHFGAGPDGIGCVDWASFGQGRCLSHPIPSTHLSNLMPPTSS